MSDMTQKVLGTIFLILLNMAFIYVMRMDSESRLYRFIMGITERQAGTIAIIFVAGLTVLLLINVWTGILE